MNNPIILLTLAGPLLLASVTLMSRFGIGPRPRYILMASRFATATTLLLAMGTGLYVAVFGASTASLIGLDPFILSIRLDALSAIMFGLVAFVGLVVVQFSRNYLDGNKRQGVFLGRLCLTLCAVAMLVLSGSLLQLVVAWIGTSIALHRLLLFYSDRPKAVVSARKKFICARIGDAFLILAAILLYTAFGTGDIAQILKVAREMSDSGDTPTSAMGAAVSIVLAAVFKSAQFPAHGWLTEVMEAPTPVSALLHAGIVNAGGFLVIRLSDVVALSGLSLYFLIVIGGITALVGTVVMLTQTNIKSSLAWSTISQMGFMLLQCGFGAFSAAALHIVAHSLYKAHAFLSSGGAAADARVNSAAVRASGPGPWNLIAAFTSASLIFVAVATLMGMSPVEKPALAALGAVLVMGLSQLLVRGLSGPYAGQLAGRFLLSVGGLSVLYFSLQHGAAWILGDVVATVTEPDVTTVVLATGLVLTFGIVTLLQLYLATWATRWPGVYVHVSNGFYVNAMFDRLVGSLRPKSANTQ